METERDLIRKRIVDKYLENPNASYAQIGRDVGVSRDQARKVILRFKEHKTTDHQKGAGRPVGFKDPDLVKKVRRSFQRSPNVSIGDLAKKYNVSRFLIHKIKRKSGLKTYKAQKTSNRNDEVNKRAKGRARKLYDQVLTKSDACILMDDETLVKADFHQIPGQKYYTATSRTGVKKIYRYTYMSKFAKKYCIWQALCSCGKMSRPVIFTGTINKDIYIKSCLQKVLLPLYRSHAISPIFWPDLATCHYARATLDWYGAQNITFVSKDQNPPNCPELRPIEKFWAIIKGKLRKEFKPAKNTSDFIRKWKKACDSVGPTGVRRLMRGIQSKVRVFAKLPEEI